MFYKASMPGCGRPPPAGDVLWTKSTCAGLQMRMGVQAAMGCARPVCAAVVLSQASQQWAKRSPQHQHAAQACRATRKCCCLHLRHRHADIGQTLACPQDGRMVEKVDGVSGPRLTELVTSLAKK